MAKPNFHEIEEKIKKFWEENKIFKAKDLSDENIYSVDTPPPNISGKMHIGHAFSYAQQDFIVRFRRMFGGNVFFPFGTDDNGLPTERLIEKSLKIKSQNMGRQEFVKVVLDFLRKFTPEAVQDWKDIGMSCDFDVTYSTIDPQAQKVSQKSFVDLFKKGHVYKKSFPTIWCPECQTSIAQAELEDKEKETNLVYLKGKLEDGSFIIYATTRPELHPGCVGISINEEGDYVKVKSGSEEWVVSFDAYEKMQEEYSLELIDKFKGKDLLGKKVEIKFSEQDVFVSHDVSAKTEYGTGVVYYCSYGGLDCVQWLGRHSEANPVEVMGEKGVYIRGPCEGLRSDKARIKIVELLKEEGLVVKEEKMSHTVNTHDKCGTDIEFVATPQWFIAVMDKKEELLEQGNKIKWYPEFMKKRYDNWVNGLEWDWSISRNRHFGIPIPAWECECGEIFVVDEKELPVDPTIVEKKCSKCGEVMLGETMVLDTWATSSVSPQIASDLVGEKVKIPFSLRPQAHDIIRTWAFYTIVKAYLHEEKIPWKDIVISGNVSLGGEKMSKSKGNVVDPKNVLEKYCADALRYWAAGSKLGQDLDYQDKDLITGKKLVNKILNASRFVFMNLEGYNGRDRPETLEKVDELFLEKVDACVKEVTESFMKYEYSKAKKAIDDFFWVTFCDNYLEIVKKRVYQGEGDAKLSAQYALYTGLLKILKMWAPIVPFITEEVYLNHYKAIEGDESIHTSSWPEVEEMGNNKSIVEKYEDGELGWDKWNILVDIISKIRQEKSNAQKAMNSEIKLTLSKGVLVDLEGMIDDLKNVTGAVEIKEGDDLKVEFVDADKE